MDRAKAFTDLVCARLIAGWTPDPLDGALLRDLRARFAALEAGVPYDDDAWFRTLEAFLAELGKELSSVRRATTEILIDQVSGAETTGLARFGIAGRRIITHWPEFVMSMCHGLIDTWGIDYRCPDGAPAHEGPGTLAFLEHSSFTLLQVRGLSHSRFTVSIDLDEGSSLLLNKPANRREIERALVLENPRFAPVVGFDADLVLENPGALHGRTVGVLFRLGRDGGECRMLPLVSAVPPPTTVWVDTARCADPLPLERDAILCGEGLIGSDPTHRYGPDGTAAAELVLFRAQQLGRRR